MSQGGTSETSQGGASELGSGGDSIGSGGVSTGGVSPNNGGSTGGIASTGGGAGGGVARPLPDLPNSPVSGGITYSDGATWDVDGTQVPAFEIHTPTANYWLIKDAAAIVEVTDNSGRKWISFSSGYRPDRGIPNLGGCCRVGNPALLGLPIMSTVADEGETLTHLRLQSTPVDGDGYWLVWDFYQTHVTVTINRSEEQYGFSYHGVPGGNLDDEDQLGISTGTRSAKDAFAEDLPGPAEWAYLTSPSAEANTALFLIQHADDSVPESYGVADGNSSKFVFGGGQLSETPIRYSLGVVDSVDHATITERIDYVIDNTLSP